MKFQLGKSIEILRRTPTVIETMISGITPDWTTANEELETWSVYDIIGHLIHGEKTDWMPRLKIILSESGDKHFEPFDRFAQFKNSQGKSIDQLLVEFGVLRADNLFQLQSLELDEQSLSLYGIHPEFGGVTVRQLLSTWVVHDLNHIAQISRVMAKQYKEEVGPWTEYLRILS